MSTASGQQPALSDADIERYARQIVIPGVGASGQAKLCASHVHVIGDPRAVAEAIAYLRAGGVHADASLPAGSTDCLLVADVHALGRDELDALVAARVPVLWYALEGTSIRCGRGVAGAATAAAAGRDARTADPGLRETMQALAACDLVASAMARLLGWRDGSDCAGVTIA